MPITFPNGPSNGDTYSPTPNPYNLVFEFDDPTNSWRIVGPDNIATTDYVDDQLKDNNSDVVRNYHLHTSVNQISITAPYILNSSDNMVGSGNPVNDITTCDDIFAKGCLADHTIDLHPPNEVLDDQVPDWQMCISNHMTPSMFETVGYDFVDDKKSYEFQHIHTFQFSETDGDGGSNEWDIESHIGDIIEVNYISGGSGNAKYAIYQVVDIVRYTVKATPSYGIRVNFLESDTPEEPFTNNSPGTFYQFRNYLQPLNSGGGMLSGDLKIVSDSTEALSVWKNEDAIGASNLYNLVLKVDTNTNKILCNDEYEFGFGQGDLLDKELLVPYGYFLKKLGIPDYTYSSTTDGPFVQIRGGTMTGTLTINRDSSLTGKGTLVLKGRSPGGADVSMLYGFKDNTNGDSVRYEGLQVDDKDLVTYGTVSSIKSDLQDQIDDRLKKNDSSDKNKMTDNLNLGSKKIIKMATPSGDDDKEGANVAYVKSKMSGKIHNGYTSTKGLMYVDYGTLYFNDY